MKRRTAWAWSSLITFVVLATVLASCGGAAGTSTSPSGTTTTTSKSPTTTTTSVVQPKHGGTLIETLAGDPPVWDPGISNAGGAAVADYVYEPLLCTDWTRGMMGNGATDYISGSNSIEDMEGCCLAESWQMPSVGVWILKIRQGVHWQQTNTPAGQLMAGRQFTPEDVVSSFNRLKADPRSWGMSSQPAMFNAATVEKTGPWEVTIKTPVDPWQGLVWIVNGAGFYRVFPPEVIARYGDVADWRNSVGTGPFILKDYVSGSSMSLVKNPNYWDTDPVGAGKGNKLPYVDAVKRLIIPDMSTLLAALRSGSIDYVAGVSLADAEGVLKTNPEIKYATFLSGLPWLIGGRRDPGTPFADVRVRQAMMLATDFNAFVQGPFRGKAEIDVYPVNKYVVPLYTPLSEMPAEVQDLFKCQPEKAKQLLKDAGYPNLKIKVLTQSTPALVDELAYFAAMWAQAGIQLVIDQREAGQYMTLAMGRKHEELIYRFTFQTFSIQLFFSGLRGTSTYNSSFIDDPIGSDPYVEQRYQTVTTNIFANNEAAYKAYRELKPYVLLNAFWIPRPTPYSYVFWQPWLKNYEGQGGLGFNKYYWIDQDLKHVMGK